MKWMENGAGYDYDYDCVWECEGYVQIALFGVLIVRNVRC